MPDAVEGRICLIEVLDVLDVPKAIRCVLLRMPEAVEGRLCLPEVWEVPEAMRCVLCRRLWRVGSV